uniref:CTP synthase n=1 Tax=Cacopsylla melanoneura TaxID=428564 RepID=A0A8D8S3P2_9HEMI
MKYILVTGGVISGVGKGVIASSFGLLLKNYGINVTAIKIDPYINIDAGTFSPYEHGEVYVLEDGAEVDLDLGNYERFLDITLHKDNNITTGKIYQRVIEEERKGSYLGKTVQVVPHITNAIQEWVEKVSHVPVSESGEIPQVCIVELGGTIGDIEGMAFVEAFRQFQFRVGHENFCCVHVSPIMESKNEFKTKPTQATVRELRGLGLSPDLVVCRSSNNIMNDVDSIREKISMFCHVTPENVIFNPDVKPIYKVPLILEKQGVLDFFRERLKLGAAADTRVKDMKMWKRFTEKIDRLSKTVTIGLVGKYTKFEDCYASLTRALEHASYHSNRRLQLKYFDSELLSQDTKLTNTSEYHQTWSEFCKVDGIIVPGGFGKRGLEGKIAACKWARENNKPFLGICLGLQAAVIEFARNVLGLQDADTEEEQPAGGKLAHPVVVYMPEHNPGNMGGTMRLGKHETHFRPEHESKLKLLYGNKSRIEERHRHRYEVNKKYVPDYEKNGFLFTGVDEKEVRMEIAELTSHPYYVAVQFHPEYLSRPLRPSPPFLGLILAAAGKLDAYIDKECRHVTDTDDDDSDYESSDNRQRVQISKVGSSSKLSKIMTAPCDSESG